MALPLIKSEDLYSSYDAQATSRWPFQVNRTLESRNPFEEPRQNLKEEPKSGYGG